MSEEIERRTPYKFDDFAKKRFLESYIATGQKYRSAAKAGVNPGTVDYHIKNNIDGFADDFEQARGLYADTLEAEIHRRAVDGVQVPIIGGRNRDQIITHVTEYSDRLLEFHAKRHIPEYREKQQMDVNVTGGVIVLEERAQTAEEWAAEHAIDVTPED